MHILILQNITGREIYFMKNRLTAVFGMAAIMASTISHGAYAQWTGGYEVSVNGKNIGVVEDAATVRYAVAMVNNKLMNEFGMDEKIEPDVKLKAIIVSDDKLSDNKDIYCAVASVSDKLTDAVRIIVDGKKTICVKDSETAQLVIEEAVKKTGVEVPIVHCTSYEQVVHCASQLAVEGDIVVLSPASTSFDMFRNFEERGNLFKDYVNKL